MIERCSCAECRTGDALPERLQGWPGAYQLPLFEPKREAMDQNLELMARQARMDAAKIRPNRERAPTVVINPGKRRKLGIVGPK